MKQPSKERGCDGKMNLGDTVDRAVIGAIRMSQKHGKQYGLYKCPHCGGHHLTTKLGKQDQYEPLVYVTEGASE